MDKSPAVLTTRIINATVVVTALGYFVDMYDFFIFNVTRMPSLKEIGLSADALTEAGLFISNFQLLGLVIGGYLWGTLGDKFGRKSCLFASILTYSLATIYCSFVQTVDQYAIARFFAGIGVAGELGVGLTLISERLTPERRGFGTTFFIILGFAGVMVAAISDQFLSWRQAYMAGGIAGLILLAARIFVLESGMYAEMAARQTQRGGLKLIFHNPRLLKKYIASILLLAPSPFLTQIIWTLAPELAKAHGVTDPVKASVTLFVGYSCVICGDLIASVLSEKLRSRKKAIIVFWCLGLACFANYLFVPPGGATGFYIANGLLGLTFGTWVVGAALIAEQVGTNIRSTAVATIANFRRALVIPMNLLFAGMHLACGSLTAVGVIGGIVFLVSLWGWKNVDETWGKNIDYEEA